MTKYVDFTWVVPVPQELLDGTVADKWIEEKDSADLEHEATFRWGFLIIPGQAGPHCLYFCQGGSVRVLHLLEE